MKKFGLFIAIVIAILWIFFSTNVQAECSGVCVQYCGHGYCTDYILHRLGVKQSGNAMYWKGNISSNQVQLGDVTIFGSTPTNSAGHVAVIEDIDGAYITISEWNWGSQSSDPIEQACGVTTRYNKLHTRTIPKSSVTRFWRPNLSSDSIEKEITIRQVGEYGWYPPSKSCINASNWYKIQDGRAIQEFTDNGICWSIDPIAYGVWYEVVFGENDLPEACIQQ